MLKKTTIWVVLVPALILFLSPQSKAKKWSNNVVLGYTGTGLTVYAYDLTVKLKPGNKFIKIGSNAKGDVKGFKISNITDNKTTAKWEKPITKDGDPTSIAWGEAANIKALIKKKPGQKKSPIKEKYWTDEEGKKIDETRVTIALVEPEFYPGENPSKVVAALTFYPMSTDSVTLPYDVIDFGIEINAPGAGFQDFADFPLGTGTPYPVSPIFSVVDSPVVFNLGEVTKGDWLVAFGTIISANDTLADFVLADEQDIVTIPTLSEWGLIIFCALLLGWMAWVIVRRRKAVNVRI